MSSENHEEFKIFFYTDEDKSQTESMWGEIVGEDYFKIGNIPFYVKGISLCDIVEAKRGENDLLWFESVIKHSGHSTYRIATLGEEQRNAFPNEWKKLENLGCTYEKMVGETMNMYAIDVPDTADIDAVYDLLELGENSGFWDFEEGHCGHDV